MTEPPRVPPAPIVPVGWQSIPTWCSSCGVHQATNHRPLCPVCLDDETRGAR